MTTYYIDWKSPLVAPIISAITAVVVVVIGNLVIPHFRARKERRRRAQYLAIRVACILDKYVEGCARVSGDYGEEDPEGFSHAEHAIPPIPEYPADIDWHSIDLALMYGLLSVAPAAERAANVVLEASEHADAPDYYQWFEARCEEYARLALLANELVTKLRQQYSVPEIPGESWNPAEYAHHQLFKIEEKRKKRAAMYAEAAKRLELNPIPPPAASSVT